MIYGLKITTIILWIKQLGTNSISRTMCTKSKYQPHLLRLSCTMKMISLIDVYSDWVHIVISVMLGKFISSDFLTPGVKWKFTKCFRVFSWAHKQKSFLEVPSLWKMMLNNTIFNIVITFNVSVAIILSTNLHLYPALTFLLTEILMIDLL